MGGIATFLEQNIERWLGNTQPSEGIIMGREFAREWMDKGADKTEYFYAETSSSPLNDHTALLVGGELEFSLKKSDQTELVSELQFELSDDDGLDLKKTGPRFKVSAEKPGDYLLSFTSGYYRKRYKISVLAQMHPEEMQSLDSWFQELDDSSQIRSEAFLNSLQRHRENEPQPKVPPQFETGLIEYYMGLKHEQERVSSFGKRYERAACLLYPFVIYSRLASFVVHYFAFRTNSWKLFGAIDYFPNLFAAARFLASKYQASNQAEPRVSSGIPYRRPLLISQADDNLIEAIRALQIGDMSKSAALCDEAGMNAEEQAYDPQRMARLELVQARMARRNGNATKASQHYLNLTTHPDSLWAEEAKLFIREQI